MAIRRTTAPRKRTIPSAIPAPPGGREGAAVAKASDEDFDGTNFRQELVDRFENALREHSEIDREGLDLLMGHLRDAIQEASLDPKVAAIPSRAEWEKSLTKLTEIDGLLPRDRDELIRQFGVLLDDEAVSQAKIALEFAKLLDQEGEDAALAWLSEQQSVDVDSTKQAIAPDATTIEQKQAITRSRSRRLRGPPSVG